MSTPNKLIALPGQYEEDARKLAKDVLNSMAEGAKYGELHLHLLHLLDDPDRQGTLCADLFALGAMVTLEGGDMHDAVFSVLLQLCRFIVARKHKIITDEDPKTKLERNLHDAKRN